MWNLPNLKKLEAYPPTPPKKTPKPKPEKKLVQDDVRFV